MRNAAGAVLVLEDDSRGVSLYTGESHLTSSSSLSASLCTPNSPLSGFSLGNFVKK